MSTNTGISNGTSNCIFCKIVKGEIPSHKVYENEKFLAFLSIEPESPGHTLVIPKEHYRWVWDVPEAGEYFEVSKTLNSARFNDIRLTQKISNSQNIIDKSKNF